MVKAGGIYQILNTTNGKHYIGSAVNFKARWRSHRHDLAHNKSGSHILQKAWIKYGEQAFKFQPLITCSQSMLLHYEQQFIDQWKPEYNICKIAGSALGTTRTDAFKIKCSERMKLMPEVTREKLRKAATGNTYRRGKKSSPETISKLKASRVGLKFSPEGCKNISTALKGHSVSQEVREGMRNRMLGNTYTKGHIKPVEERAALSAKMMGRVVSEATKAKLKESRNKRPPATEETKRKMSDAHKRRLACTLTV